MSTDNPYTAPQRPDFAMEILPEAEYLDWPLSRVLRGVAIVTLVAGVCVLTCQVVVPSRLMLLKAASFASVGSAAAFVFGGRRRIPPDSQFPVRLCLFSIALMVALVVWTAVYTDDPQPKEWIFYTSVGMAHIGVPAAVCWIRRLRIRVVRLLTCGLVAAAIWLALAIMTIEMYVEDLQQPYADYVGFTSLTMLWAMCTATATAVVLRAPAASEPPG